MKRLFLLDGMALIYRAHFTLIQAPIRNSKVVNISAFDGFISTLLSILEKENPTHIGVAFYRRHATFSGLLKLDNSVCQCYDRK